jgi:hypothetical protein
MGFGRWRSADAATTVPDEKMKDEHDDDVRQAFNDLG